MKRLDIFCSSPASTAICSSLNYRSAILPGSTRPRIDRSQSSKLYYEKSRKSTSSSSAAKPSDLHRKSSADIASYKRLFSIKQSSGEQLRRKSSADVSDLQQRVPDNSTKYLLRDKPFVDLILEPADRRKDPKQDPPALKSCSSARSPDQDLKVVVLRMSIHCKGCEVKVRKHISKMEGVTSFTIDFATKKVTVVGDVTPSGVLASLSKVKNAQLWPSPATPTPSSKFST